MKKLSWSAIKTLLHEHYSAPLESVFKQFRAGAIFFAVGLIIIYLANTTLPESLKQEVIVLFALIMAGGGFIVAMLAQIRMLISRFYTYFRNK